ncbi:MAG: decarboxylating 6-phosphogluconate dehydrogenase [Acidobacteria bacterium]|nr:decarboxylating 6-phosphogluconate dehydrogenase [Acidobacteriota bacterium]
MELGMVGLGKMGAFMTERLVEAGHRLVGFDLDPAAVERVVAVGATGAESIEDLVGQLDSPRAVWIMVPAGDAVDKTLEMLLPVLDDGDVIVDGGNSYYRDTLRRAEACREGGQQLVDVGTSGGVWGLTEGYSMMVGGEAAVVDRLRPILESLAPGRDQGWGHVGPTGAGHFVKMIHNGIEYGLMEAYAEGFAIMAQKDEFGLDLHQIAEIWRYGSVVRSWLLDLTAEVLAENPDMEGIAPYVPDSGEGRWTVFEAIDSNVSAPIITLSLMRRIGSRDEYEYADRLLSAMRHQFGGHAIKLEPPQ